MFTDHPLLKPFTSLEPNYFPAEEIRNVLAHHEEIRPVLLEVLKDFAENAEGYSEDDGNCLHIVALAVLAQFRDLSLFPVLLDIVDRFDLDLWGEASAYEELICSIPEPAMARIIASVMAENISELKAIVIDPKQDIELRCRSLEALKTCYFEGDMERSDLTNFMSGLFQTFQIQHDSPEFFPLWISLYDQCLDIHPQEMLDGIQDACNAGFLGEQVIGRTLERAKRYCEGSPEQWFDTNREQLIQESGYIREAEKELEKWGMNQVFEFDQEDMEEITSMLEDRYRKRTELNKEIGDVYRQIFHESTDTPFTRGDSKVGRNDPCPCGSGKKFKKCCGR